LVLHLTLGCYQFKHPPAFNAAVVVGLMEVDVEGLLSGTFTVRGRDCKSAMDDKIQTILTFDPHI